MKSLIIIVSVLTVMTNGFNIERLRKFRQNLAKCNEEFGGPISEHIAENVYCAAKSDGQVLDSKGEIIQQKVLKAYEEGISDTNRLQQATTKFNKCYDEGLQSGNTGKEQTLKIFMCSADTLDLFDKID
ncbi:uncharacterized protein LOC109503743 [Harpegnathos saltator]|uniref:uncharacterized protein LOC109503743 n=1 Tax=Harpegnathos saltator TaxID=610380 RepID=UPI000DBEEBCD|nr:uncharacterized protein LOC109503743 [Harpegnathos saltator]